MLRERVWLRSLRASPDDGGKEYLKRAGRESGSSRPSKNPFASIFRMLPQRPQQPPPTPSCLPTDDTAQGRAWGLCGSTSGRAEKILPMGERLEKFSCTCLDGHCHWIGRIKKEDGDDGKREFALDNAFICVDKHCHHTPRMEWGAVLGVLCGAPCFLAGERAVHPGNLDE